MVSWREAFAIENPTAESETAKTECLERNLVTSIARIDNVKTVVPTIAQLEVLTDEIKFVPTGTIADKKAMLRLIDFRRFVINANTITTAAISEFSSRIFTTPL